MIRNFVGLALLISLMSCNQPLKKVHVGITPFFGEAAFYVAQSNGFFEEFGLDVISHSHSAGKKSLQKIYSGELDIAHTADLPMVYALAGFPEYKGDITPKICANMIHNRHMQKVIVRNDQGIETPQDLIGKKVGYYEGTTSEFFLDTFLLEHNIPESTLTKKNINVVNQFDALKNAEVDAVVSWEPYASSILSQLEKQTSELNTMIDHSTLWLVVSSGSYISENPEVIKTYLQAIKKAQEYIKINPGEVQKLLAQKTNSSEDLIAKLWPNIDYELSIDEHMIFLMEDQQRWLQQKEYVDQADKVDYEKYVYFEAIENLYPEGVTIIQ